MAGGIYKILFYEKQNPTDEVGFRKIDHSHIV